VAAKPPVKVVGYQLLEFADFWDGADIHPGELILAERTQQTDRTVGKALGQIRAWGLIWRYREGSKQGRQQLSDEYRLTVPASVLSSVPLTAPIPDELVGRLGLTARAVSPTDRPNEVRVMLRDQANVVRVIKADQPNLRTGSPEPHDTDHPNDVRPTYINNQFQDLSLARRSLHAMLAAVVPDVTERETGLVIKLLEGRPAVQSGSAVLPREIENGNGQQLVAQVRRQAAAPSVSLAGGSPSDIQAKALCGRCGSPKHPKTECPTLIDAASAGPSGGQAA
jgi:hypothetical protein